jgi:hypothetical protein
MPAPDASAFHSVLAARPAIGLAALDELAALRTRRDRKYLLADHDVAAAVLLVAERLVALEVGGRRTFDYRSLYFDTPDLASYRGAATGRRRRFKVRLRQYAVAGPAVLEVKTRTGRGETVKCRVPHDGPDVATLSPDAQEFVDELVGWPGLGASLRPVVWTGYRRSTLVDIADRSRITVDHDVRAAPVGGGWARLTDRVVVETKGAGAASPLDRTLWDLGRRPAGVSKYAAAMAAADPSLATNRWHRVLQRHFAPPLEPGADGR